jgi:glycosyltransferase involved in cell wall biosynthesis
VADSSRPKILLAVEQLRRSVPGGIGVHATGLLRGLDQCASEGEPTDVTLFASRTRGADGLTGFGRPVVTSRLPGPLLTRAWDHGLLHAPAGFDVVHSVSLAAPLVRHSHRSRLIVTVHDLAWRRYPGATTARGRRWHEAALRRARDRGAALVVPSRFVASELAAAGLDRQRISVVYGGSDHLDEADPAGADELLARCGVSGEFLLTVGTLEPRKNLDRLVRAYALARASLPRPWPLVVVGPTGWGSEPAGSRWSEGVVFAGTVVDPVLADLYRRARAFAYVPLTEGYGLPPLEAMRVGTPSVVADEVPSVRDLGEPGPPPARLVDPLDVESIAHGIADVLTDEEMRGDLGSRGTAYAGSRTWRAAAREVIALWSAVP